MLSSHNIPFESINIQSDPSRLAELLALGARSIPVVSHGQEWVFGQMLKDVAKFIGVDYDLKPKLSPQELIDRLDLVMSAAQRFIAQIPEEQLDKNLRNRKRPIRDLCYHLFHLEEVFLDVVENGVALTRDLLDVSTPSSMRTTKDLVAYGHALQQRLRNWWARYDDKICSREIESYYGKQAVHYVLERFTWHPAQHVRQLMMLLRENGIEPNQPVSDAQLAGLPLPQKVWDDEPA